MGRVPRKGIPLTACLILLFSVCRASTVKDQYAKARQVRALCGHDAAQPLYQEILEFNPHDRSAATRIAANPDAGKVHSLLGKAGSEQERLTFISKLRHFQFQPHAIAQAVFGGPSSIAETANRSSAPLYLKPLRAGVKCPPLPESPLAACIQLLLMAICLPREHCVDLLGTETVELMECLGIVHHEQNEDLLVPYCHVMPVRTDRSDEALYLATDLHPDALSSTTVPSGDGAVMYIGPDSLALLDHCNLKNDGWLMSATEANMKIVDIGCGSGIQGLRLAAAKSQRIGQSQVTSVDINKRALTITKLNFEWNGLDSPRLVLGDIAQSTGGIESVGGNDIISDTISPTPLKTTTWSSIFNGATHILANPPFLPVPVQDDEISKRYGLFSSGGASGEDVLRKIIELSAECWSCSSSEGRMAIVSEFMNPDSTFSRKLGGWWRNGGNPKAEAFLFSNQQPLSADEYSSRRADSEEETERWNRHLEQEKISTVSPGMLYVHCFSSSNSSENELTIHLHLVPKSDQGSVWTPTNEKAQLCTQQVLDSFMENPRR